jgi:hypothetical protein
MKSSLSILYKVDKFTLLAADFLGKPEKNEISPKS